LKEVLEVSDFVTLHVPENAQTKNMIGEQELSQMKKGACLLNLSRGTVVVIDALTKALQSKHLNGAALDVFPEEPESNDVPFTSSLCGLPNVILTPHIGGSTEEAQKNIAREVAAKLVKYSDTGSTTGAVNFPEIELPVVTKSHRILNIHKNVPGVLRDINKIIADAGGNIRSQYLSTTEEVGYLIIDIEQAVSAEIRSKMEALPTSIRTRILF
jgi:D-3-phosphoglycerate dehydrogenase